MSMIAEIYNYKPRVIALSLLKYHFMNKHSFNTIKPKTQIVAMFND